MHREDQVAEHAAGEGRYIQSHRQCVSEFEAKVGSTTRVFEPFQNPTSHGVLKYIKKIYIYIQKTYKKVR